MVALNPMRYDSVPTSSAAHDAPIKALVSLGSLAGICGSSSVSPQLKGVCEGDDTFSDSGPKPFLTDGAAPVVQVSKPLVRGSYRLSAALSCPMLLTLTTTRSPATDLGFLLHKHPDKLQTFALSFGHAHVFYPEADAARCTAALLLGVDPVGLTRRAGRSDFALYPYVNDRPYVASSFLSVALARVFGSALNGLCPTRPELLVQELPLSATLAALPCRGGPGVLGRLFGPLGYTLEVKPTPLDPAFPEWGDADLYTVTLRHELPLAQLLRHLYVLVPVLDDEKHYWVGDEEVAKLLEKGAGWLNTHPAREEITRRYLKHQRSLARAANEQFVTAPDVSESEPLSPRLHNERLDAVFAALKASGAASVLDLGCGEGRLTEKLLAEPQFTRIVGTDVSLRALERARRRLRTDERPENDRLTLFHSSLLLRDARLAGFDAAALVEVLEHLEPTRLEMFERILFGYMKPKTVVLSTPNREYNAVWPGLKGLRHPEHRFEWTRAEFRAWAERVSAEYGYGVTLEGVGPEVAPYGQPSQMAVFRAA